MRRLAWVILSALCFGAGLTVSRLGLKEFSPLDYTALRLVAALLAFVVFYAAFRRRPPPLDRKLWMFGLALGVVGTALPMLGIITALQHLSSGVASVVATSGPAFAVIFAHALLPDERITTRKTAGVVLALAGAILLALQGETGLRARATDVTGYVFLIGALALSHGSLVLSRRFLKKQDVLDVVCIQMVGATLFLAPLALRPGDLARVGDVGLAWFTVLFGGLIGTFLAFNARFKLVKEFGATDAALVDYVVPVVSTLTGTLFAGEHITAPIVICMGVILLGVHLVHPERLARRPAHQPIPTVPSVPNLKRAEE